MYKFQAETNSLYTIAVKTAWEANDEKKSMNTNYVLAFLDALHTIIELQIKSCSSPKST